MQAVIQPFFLAKFFGALGASAALFSVVLSASIVIEFVQPGLVPRLPTG
jgi:hypothetical protein